MTAGGLTLDGLGWRRPKNPRFWMPGRSLSLIFRAKLRDALRNADLYDSVPMKAWRQKWVVHLQHAGSGEKVLEYLGRYLFRPPISNRCLERSQAGHVTFRYRDGPTRDLRRCTTTSEEFIRRFLQHVLPRGFTRVRHYGCFSPASGKKLVVARSLLESITPPAVDRPAPRETPTPDFEIAESKLDPSETLAGPPQRRCPFCKKGRMQRIGVLPRPSPLLFSPRAPP